VARNVHTIAAPPEAVFDVLADPRSYAYWVIGSMKIRDASPDWPQAGSRFDHTVGIGPLRLNDHTVVEEVRPGRFLQLRASAKPFGNARIKFELEPSDEGTRVTMIEDPADAPTAFVFTPLTHLLTRLRNVHSLDRLAELAEGRRPIPGDEPGAPVRTPDGPGAVENPRMRTRHQAARTAGRAVAFVTIGGVAAAGTILSRAMRAR
jgi:uncharacterized protein YndB with AHSA1/START domain